MSAPWIASCLAAGSLAGLGACAAAGAQPVWHAPVAIAPQGTAAGSRPAVALAPHGEALAAWRAVVRGRLRVEVRTRRGLRAPWSAPDVLAGRPGRTWAALSDPAVAMNARGDAVVLWQVAEGPLRAAVRRGWTGPWRTATVPAPPAGADAGAAFATPRVAVAADGGAVALWAAQAGGAWVVRGARLAAGSPAWQAMPGPPLDAGLPAPPSAPPPGIAVAAGGAAVAAWTVPSQATGAAALRVARRSGTGAWGPPATLADPGAAPAVAMAPDGRAAVAWTTSGHHPPSPVALALGEPGAAGLQQVDGPPGAVALGPPAAAVDSRGDVLVAWSAGTEGAAHAAVRPAGGGWGATMDVEGGVSPATPVALDEAGTAQVGTVFTDPGSLAHEWPFSVVAGTAAGWGLPRRVVYGGGDGAIATSSGGTAIVVARGEPGTVWAASYDALPDVRVTARLSGRWVAGHRAVRWTVRVRNAGRIAARGVRLRLQADAGARFVAARPAASGGAGRTRLWRLGRLGPGRTRTIVAAIRPPSRDGAASLQATVSAAGMPPRWVPARVGAPGGGP